MNKKTLLIDLDGVLRIGNQPADGVEEFFNFLRSSAINSAIISNSTMLNGKMVSQFFSQKNINCPIPIMTSADAALKYVSEKFSQWKIFCSEPVKSMFHSGITETDPEAVIVGDMGDEWNFQILNGIFKDLMDGSELIAMQKNRFWKTPEKGILLDAGPFVKALEYASGKEAVLIGKPSEIYFRMGLKTAGSSENEDFYMLGDDLETDIAGAAKLGGKTILILTGKTNKDDLGKSEIKPEFIAENLYNVIELLRGVEAENTS